MNSYKPIENYGIIGDNNTIALVNLDGSIDFLCFPDFDSPSIFAALLDQRDGGYFKISPLRNNLKHKQLYLPDTNVLLTRFLANDGVAEITDFMPVSDTVSQSRRVLFRTVSCVRGDLTFSFECKPRFDYSRSTHRVVQQSDYVVHFTTDSYDRPILKLTSTVPLTIVDHDLVFEFTLAASQKATFKLEYSPEENDDDIDLAKTADHLLYQTINFWKDWVSQTAYQGRWSEIVNRSALVLKLMTSKSHGSIVAAPTFGLPEEIGGIRNWDYRYTWIRDASFTVYAFIKLGYKKEARQFMEWVERQCKDIGDAGHLSLMYRMDGSKELGEMELSHLEGYRKSKPVRIGNAAHEQIQLDIYGELLDAIYLFDKHVERISYDFWRDICRQVDWVSHNWKQEDEGIWEVRGGKREFLYSRMMCWVALDRAIKIANSNSYPFNSNWASERDKIFYSIHEEFWNENLRCFVQYKGANTVDGATLLMPIIRFIGPTDNRWLSTLQRIESELVSDSLLYRYRQDNDLDGLSGGEGTFSMCTFWYVECLAKAGHLNKARLFFEKMLGYSNHLGLYSEMLGPQGEHLGNFPQAFTHLGLITAALALDHQFDDQRNKEADQMNDV